MRHVTRPGTRFPPGATPTCGGVNFCVYSRHATGVELLLYEREESEHPFQVVELSPEENRTYSFWHVFVEDLGPGTCYTWRAHGPADTGATGRRFDARRELLDPWARAVSDRLWDRRQAIDPQRERWPAMRAIVTAPPGKRGLPVTPRTLEGAVIYELHVGGFTRHPSSGVARPGTFAGLVQKIPYLQALGVTHVELMPVMAFDEQDLPPAVAALGLRNYWGYSTHSFFAPHPRYCVAAARADEEFRAFSAAMHAAGIGVLLDVVFNHTAEGGADGPVIHFKGLANEMAYHLDARDRSRYRDYTGCGNTLNCNHPLVTAFIVRCLEYWVEDMGVDGFRFDLASVFARDQSGELISEPPLPWAIESSRVIAPATLIAEAWDARGLYQVGQFPGMAWTEWNGRYRDVIRRFVRGDPGLAGEVATRIAGSSDLFGDDGRRPGNSINFVTCHDGFTLADLVSYEVKHNCANGEHDRDGSNDNASCNCGVEGPSTDPAVLRARHRQARNFLALMLLSRGVPMLLAGDEVLRTQHGNNNAWCQDNELSWFDWRFSAEQQAMLRFTREVIALRRRHRCLTLNRFFAGVVLAGREIPDIAWHGVGLEQAPWHDGDGRFLRFTIAGLDADEEDLHVILNMRDTAVDVELPACAARRWHLAVDTAREPPHDVVPRQLQCPLPATRLEVQPRSVVVLEARA
jgi:glycogen operon protein